MKPRTEATTEMEASEERMSREDGMRYCYQAATFYLFMPGSQERSARVLEGRMLCLTDSLFFNRRHRTCIMVQGHARDSPVVRPGTRDIGKKRSLRPSDVKEPVNSGYIPRDVKVPRSTDARIRRTLRRECWRSLRSSLETA